MIRRALSTLSALALLCLLSACASVPEATTDYNPDFDFAGVKTIALKPVDRSAMSNMRMSDMQIDRINAAITTELEKKGYQVVSDAAQADMWLTWNLVTEERTDVRTYNSMSYYNCWRCGPAVSDVSVSQYTLGTFIVDMIDPETTRSVWRSVIQSRIKPEQDSKKAAERRRAAATAVFAQFPPGQ